MPVGETNSTVRCRIRSPCGLEQDNDGFKPAASLTEQIANHLSDEIINGRLAPLERIQEQRVAKDLGVSRGSVREALLIVEGRHLIDIMPRRGAVVSGLEPVRIGDLTEFFGELILMLLARVAAKVTGNGGPHALDGFQVRVGRRWARTCRPSRSMRWCRQS